MLHDPQNITGSPAKTASAIKPLRITDHNGIRSFIAILTESCYPKIVEAHKDWFNPTEWSYVCSLNVEKRRKEFVLGRCAGKLAASAYLCVSNLTRLIVEAGAFGQPILRFLTDDNPELSITHSDSVALAATSRQGYPIGIDIEKLSDRDISFLKSHITESDLMLLAGVSPNTQHAYLRAWTIKEALSKILRCGITIPFELLELASTTALDTNSLRCNYRNFPQYHCHSWVLGPYFIAVTTPRSMKVEVDTEVIRSQLMPSDNQNRVSISMSNGVR